MILALHTAGSTTEAWLYLPESFDAPVATLKWESGRNLADELLARLTQFLDQQKITLQDLTGLVIFSGPGSFTSLRIGHSVMNALADSLRLPVAGGTGDNWLHEAIISLEHTPARQPVLPHYGSEPHITRSKT